MIIVIPTANGVGLCMNNSRNGSTLVSVICAFFIFFVCLIVFTVSLNSLSAIRAKTHNMIDSVNKCIAAYYSDEPLDAEVTERAERINVYDEEGEYAFSFHGIIREAEYGGVKVYGFSSDG